MNKKINLVLIAAGVILIAVVGGVLIYNNKEKAGKPKVVTDSKKDKKEATSAGDLAYIYKDDGKAYEINPATKESKVSDEKNVDLSSLTGLPKATDSVSNIIVVSSDNEKNLLVASITSDMSKEPSAIDGSYPVVSGQEYACEIAKKSCKATTILDSASKAAGITENWYNQLNIEWNRWDSDQSLLYGVTIGESGYTFPMYKFNANSNKIEKIEGKTDSEIPGGSLSPTMSKFVTIEGSIGSWSLLLYESSNSSNPLKKFDISSMMDPEEESNDVDSVDWSKDEGSIVLASSSEIYKLDVNSGQLVLIFTDESEDENDPGIDSSAVEWSSGEKYVVFIDYDSGNEPFDESKSNTVLKAIDLENNNNVIELLREEAIDKL